LLVDFLPYYTLKSGGKRPKDLIKEINLAKKSPNHNQNKDQNNF